MEELEGVLSLGHVFAFTNELLERLLVHQVANVVLEALEVMLLGGNALRSSLHVDFLEGPDSVSVMPLL